MTGKKTATITWIKYYNFGTYLQAYALQQVIIRLGYENVIVDDTCIVEEGRITNRSLPSRIIFLLKKIIIKILSLNNKELYLFKKQQKKAIKKYESFKSSLLKIDYRTLPLTALGQRYDQYICGSDQIWSPSDDIFSPYYYLAFTEKKKIAYAPSVGTTYYPEFFAAKTKPLLERFAHLSVRENRGKVLLKSVVDRDVETVADPTLLLTKQDWNLLLTNNNSSEKKRSYILCYFLTKNIKYMDAVRAFSKKKGLPVKIFATNHEYLSYGDEALFCGPVDFMQAIKDAEIFFTDSYHGSIFALQFEKVFYTFKRFSDSSPQNQNSRIEHLFSKIGIENYFIGEEDLDKMKHLPLIDYVQVKQKISEYREHSISYLSKALKSE